VSYLNGLPKALPDQPVRTVDPEVQRLAHAVVDGLIDRLAKEPAVPAASLLEMLAGQLQEAAALRRLGVVRRETPAKAPAKGVAPGAVPPRAGGRVTSTKEQPKATS